jgi:hypothetical protein
MKKILAILAIGFLASCGSGEKTEGADTTAATNGNDTTVVAPATEDTSAKDTTTVAPAGDTTAKPAN